MTDSASASGSLKLTIDQTKIDSSLTDFPVLVHLGTSSGINTFDASAVFTEIGNDADRKKISVTTASGTPLYVEIEKWDTANKQAWLWIKVPGISGTTDTILYLNYDRNRADNAYVGDTGSAVAQNVWNSGYVAVYHMNDQGTVTKDSTGRHDGTRTGTFNAVTGPVGPAADFSGTSYITIPDHDGFSLVTTGHLLVSAWLSPNKDTMPTEQGDDGIRLLAKSESGNHEWLLDWHNKGTERSEALSWYACNLAGGLCTGEYFYPYSDARGHIPVGTWKHPVGRLDESAAVVNGVSRTHWVSTYWDGLFRYGQSLDATATVKPQNGNAPVKMGRNDYTNSWWYGKLDEVRIESAARSDAWIKAAHYSESDKLITFAVSSSSATCTDGIQNQGETGIDCGGPCPACSSTPDTVSPIRSNGKPTGTITTSTATLSLSTNEASTCKYSTTAGTAYDSMASAATASGTSHSWPLSGFSNGAKSYYVRCRDTAGNKNTDDYAIPFTVSSSSSTITIGADANPTGNPIGGGAGYNKIIYQTDADYVVSTKTDLINALNAATSGQIIYVSNTANIDLTNTVLTIKGGVTLASGRQARENSGGRLFTNSYTSSGGFINIAGAGVRITGLRIVGPNPTLSGSLAHGIYTTYPNLEVDNNEISGWSYAGIYFYESTNAGIGSVHHNYIHHSQKDGYGYGVEVGRNAWKISITANIFDYYRHAVAGVGDSRNWYEFSYNVLEDHTTDGAIDFHGSSGGNGGYAGRGALIHHNTVKVTNDFAVSLRGQAYNETRVYNNWFYRDNPNNAIELLNYAGSRVYPGYNTNPMTNTYIYNNWYGTVPPVGTATPTCSDGIKNQGETGIDCGGPCPACSSTPDTASPIRSNGKPTGTITTSTATLSLSTNEAATCKYSTISGTSYDSMASAATSSGTSHSWTISGLTSGAKSYYVKCKDAAGNKNTDDYTISFTVSSESSINQLNLKPGWNQISLPIVEGIDIATIESSCTILQYKNQKLWAWDAQTQLWSNPTKIEPLKGYWIYVAYVCTVPLSGTPATFNSLQLYSGWNKVSAQGSLSAIAGTCAGHITGSWIWNWDKATEKWVHPVEMQLDKGYWIKVDRDCVLGV